MASNTLVGIVDFNRAARDTYAALLYIELGLRVVVAATVPELIAKLQSTIPDMLIVGGDHPSLKGGLGAVEALNARFPAVPLIAIGRHYPTLGADEVLDEPVDAAELVGLARSLLRRMPA